MLDIYLFFSEASIRKVNPADVIRMYFSCVSTLYIYIYTDIYICVCDSVIIYAYAEWYSDMLIYCVLFVNSVELSRACPNGKIVSYFQTSWS